ncbi:hypothetical protein [Butyricicoccus sp.]|uniref:hypothetical protein n=1 Tax=Butyricicoccus sp. TaxID=2049021 RepID=UPI003F149E88
MKNKKRIIVAAGICLLAGLAWTQFGPEARAVKQAFFDSQELMFQTPFQSENGKTDMLTEEEIQTYLDDYSAQIDQCYAKENPCREMYKGDNEHLLRVVCKEKVQYQADGGLYDCRFSGIWIHPDGQTATVHAVSTEWGKWVEQKEDDGFEVTAPTGRDTITATMVKEGGAWKLKNIDDMYVEFGADIVSDLEASGSLSSELEDWLEKTSQPYETFDEALAAADSLNPEEINPFAVNPFRRLLCSIHL